MSTKLNSNSNSNSNSNWRRRDLMSHKCGLRQTIFFLNGDKYIGEWLNNKMHGKGSYTWKSSNKTYHGDWSKGQRCGHGVLTRTLTTNDHQKEMTTCEYVGQWKDNVRHGHGINTYENGDLYDGDWSSDRRDGIGKMKYAIDGSQYEGNWNDDVREGKGTLTMENGDFYDGQWLNDMKHGRGRYVFASKENANVLESTWINSVPKEGLLFKL